MTEIKSIIQFKGNENLLAILCLDEDDKLFAIYAKIKGITFNTEEKRYDFGEESRRITTFIQKFVQEIILELDTFKENHLMIIVSVRDVEEYEHIYSVVENLI